MIESLRRITRVEMSSPHFTAKAPVGYAEALTNSVATGPAEALDLLPLQSVTIDIKCTLCVLKDPPQLALGRSTKGAGFDASSTDQSSITSANTMSGRQVSWSTSPSGNYFTNTTIPSPAPMSVQAAKYFLTDFGEDNIFEAWMKCVRTMILLPFLSDLDTSTYTLQLQQAASLSPHSMTNTSFLSSNVQIDKLPVLPPQELTGMVANYPPDYTKLASKDSNVPLGVQVLEGLVSGTLPAPTVTFKLAFTVPNIDEGPKMFGVLLTMLNAPAIISSTPLPLGCLSLGTVICPAILDHLLTLSCSSRRIGPNRVLVACKAGSRVPKRGAMVEEAMYRNVFLTNLYFDAPSSCMGKSLGSMAQLPHDPQQRLAATHHTAPLIQALVRSIDVTPLRQTADYYPITLRKYESFNFVFMIELKPEFAYLANYAAKLASAVPPQMATTQQQLLQNQNYRRSMALSKGAFSTISAANKNNSNPLASSALSGTSRPVAAGVIGIGAGLHEKRLNEQMQKQQLYLQQQQQRQSFASSPGDGSNPHQRTNSVFRYRSGGVTMKGASPIPTPKNIDDPLSPGDPSRRRGHFISGDLSEYAVSSARHMRGSLLRGTTQFGNNNSDIGLASPEVGYAHMSHEELLLYHILQETIETTVVLSYEIDASVSASSRAVQTAGEGTVITMGEGGQQSTASAAQTPNTVPTAGAEPLSKTLPSPAPAPLTSSNTLSMRWQAPVKWSFNARQYDINGLIIPTDLGMQQPLDHGTSADLAWLNVSTPTNNI